MQYKCTTRQAVRPVGYGPSLRAAQLLPPGPRGTRPWHPARPLPCHPVALRSVPAAALTCSRPAPASAPRARPHEPRPCTPVGGAPPNSATQTIMQLLFQFFPGVRNSGWEGSKQFRQTQNVSIKKADLGAGISKLGGYPAQGPPLHFGAKIGWGTAPNETRRT